MNRTELNKLPILYSVNWILKGEGAKAPPSPSLDPSLLFFNLIGNAVCSSKKMYALEEFQL